MRLALGLSFLAVFGLAAPAQAQQHPILVELFTSQGCAACPPADKLLSTLADREDVIALALHVDYWDYIGWTDSFGRPENTSRQKNYARSKGRGSVYTPQMIIGGIADVKGSSSSKVMAAIQDHLTGRFNDSDVSITLTGNLGEEIAIRIEADGGLRYAADIQLVRYTDAARVEISGGENNGRMAEYRNIVTSWEHLGKWDGVAPFSRNLRADEGKPLVVIVQEQGLGPVLAVARKR